MLASPSEGSQMTERLADMMTPAKLEALGKAVRSLELLASESYPRMTVRQALLFLGLAEARSRGRSTTMLDLRVTLGIGRSAQKSKEGLMPASPRNPEGLGWIDQETDDADRRQRYLVLTERGEEIVERMWPRSQSPRPIQR